MTPSAQTQRRGTEYMLTPENVFLMMPLGESRFESRSRQLCQATATASAGSGSVRPFYHDASPWL